MGGMGVRVWILVYICSMAGIYIHIPFCRSKCFYCGFYSVASLQLKKKYIEALCREVELRKNYLSTAPVSTLYFGGGTPSCLEEDELGTIVACVRKYWNLSDDLEFSLEMNPEDAQKSKLLAFRNLGANRLTIGVQSFNDDILRRINRTHSAQQALNAVTLAQKCGFDNIGIDLIIGLPGSTMQDLQREIDIVKSLDISHVSVYILSIDSNTVFEKLSEKGKFTPQEDDLLAEQYLMISESLRNIGYEHYEISNFAKESKYSRHNTSYWQQESYLGIGAAAHSFDGKSRQWNISHIKRYIDSLNDGNLLFEKEELSNRDLFNEYLMTNFRTMWGVDPCFLATTFPVWWREIASKLEGYIKRNLMFWSGNRIRLSEQGWLLSDGIFSELFV